MLKENINKKRMAEIRKLLDEKDSECRYVYTGSIRYSLIDEYRARETIAGRSVIGAISCIVYGTLAFCYIASAFESR